MRRIIIGLAAVLSIAWLPSTSGSAAPPKPGEGVPAFGHVFVIIG